MQICKIYQEKQSEYLKRKEKRERKSEKIKKKKSTNFNNPYKPTNQLGVCNLTHNKSTPPPQPPYDQTDLLYSEIKYSVT
jgi:hypothetical protein